MSLPAGVGGGLWRVGRDLHQFDPVAVGIGDPILPVTVETLRWRARDGQAALSQLAQRRRQVVDKQAEMIVAGRRPGLGAALLRSGEQLKEVAGRNLEIDDPR